MPIIPARPLDVLEVPVTEAFPDHVCRFSAHCFLNCYGCEVARLATEEEKRQAKKDREEHKKRCRKVAV